LRYGEREKTLCNTVVNQKKKKEKYWRFLFCENLVFFFFFKVKIGPAGFPKPPPVQWFRRFETVRDGFSLILTGFADWRFTASVRTGAVTGSRSNRSNRPVRSGFNNIGFN
jgi:hypothetical protein